MIPLSRSTFVAVALGLVVAACASSPGVSSESSSQAVSSSSSTSVDDAGLAFAPLDLRVGELPDSLGALSGSFSKHIDVWGIHIVGTAATDDEKMVHAANVMAQYLDNDADSKPDNADVVASMLSNRATLLMAAAPEELENLDLASVFGFVGQGGQDLYASETSPTAGFDASLEEIHHLILNTGWAQVFPDQLGQVKGSAIAGAMDIARGGQFDTIPNPYPSEAWFTYDDQTCDYTCMLTEYTYWAHTSLLGLQQGRADEIGHEWRLETPDKTRTGDVAATAVLEGGLGLPTVGPDGNYQPSA